MVVDAPHRVLGCGAPHVGVDIQVEALRPRREVDGDGIGVGAEMHAPRHRQGRVELADIRQHPGPIRQTGEHLPATAGDEDVGLFDASHDAVQDSDEGRQTGRFSQVAKGRSDRIGDVVQLVQGGTDRPPGECPVAELGPQRQERRGGNRVAGHERNSPMNTDSAHRVVAP